MAGFVPEFTSPGEEESLVCLCEGVVVPAGYFGDIMLVHWCEQVELPEIVDLCFHADFPEK